MSAMKRRRTGKEPCSGSHRCNQRIVSQYFHHSFQIVGKHMQSFDANAIWVYDELGADLERRGLSIGSLDTLIAAHALSLDTVLVTNNTRELSQVKDLKVENWVG